MDETRQFEDIGKDQTKSAKRNFRKEIAEYRKQLEALELEEAKEKLAPTIDLIRDEIMHNQEAMAVTSCGIIAESILSAVSRMFCMTAFSSGSSLSETNQLCNHMNIGL